MQHLEHSAEFRSQLVHGTQKRYRVGSAGDGNAEAIAGAKQCLCVDRVEQLLCEIAVQARTF
jgi:hypothetical protein